MFFLYCCPLRLPESKWFCFLFSCFFILILRSERLPGNCWYLSMHDGLDLMRSFPSLMTLWLCDLWKLHWQQHDLSHGMFQSIRQSLLSTFKNINRTFFTRAPFGSLECTADANRIRGSSKVLSGRTDGECRWFFVQCLLQGRNHSISACPGPIPGTQVEQFPAFTTV